MAFHTRKIVIDLTESDDEASQPVQHRIIDPSTNVSQDFSVPNHVLSLTGTLNFTVDGLARGRDSFVASSEKASYHSRRTKVSETTRRRNIAQSGTLYPQLGNLESTDLWSTGHVSRKTSHNAQDFGASMNHSPNVANTAKRRKTYKGMASPQTTNTYNPGPSFAVLSSQNLAKGIRLANRGAESVIVPVPNNLPVGISPKRSRNATSRVSTEGRIRKPTLASNDSSLAISREHNERMGHVLRSQVFVHIKTAISRYRDRLTTFSRTAIGTKTAGILVGDASFADNFTANKWKLSAEYERKLSVRAQTYVDKYAAEVLNSSESSVRRESVESDSAYSVNTGRLTSSHGSEDRLDKKWRATSSPVNWENGHNTSSDDFDLRSEHCSPSSGGIKRNYSSSPTTSFSHDLTDEVTVLDEIPRVSQVSRKLPRSCNQTIQLRRSSRRALRQAPAAPSTEPSHTQPAVELKQDGNLLDQEPNFAAIRDVELWRLAGLDINTPRPYINLRDRRDIKRGCDATQIHKAAQHLLSNREKELLYGSTIHVDFCLEEMEFLCNALSSERGDSHSRGANTIAQITYIMAGQGPNISDIVRRLMTEVKKPGGEVGRHLLRIRGKAAITAFLQDASMGSLTMMPPHLVRLETKPLQRSRLSNSSISSLLRQRETGGIAPFRVSRGQQSFQVEIFSHLEDSMARRSEWTDCCGDISALSWTSENAFICGATAHSDYHNMQYNKPGNLLVGSSSLDTLRAIPDHRVIRPIIAKEDNADNAMESMRQTQDPWLYTSVVSTSHSTVTGYTFTASFDEMVKVWMVSKDGSSMDLRGTWHHDGKVNFVVTSEHHEMVATASDVGINAIRVYHFDECDITRSLYDTYTGDKSYEQAVEHQKDEAWAYFPATIQWGSAKCVAHLLLVGYSPRSLTANESDIPPERKNSGELCLWNVYDGSRVSVSSARSQNVFEVIWHPTHPCFLAATSPCGTFEPETKTQVRLFAQNETGAFVQIKVLDCPAFDINELTVSANSYVDCYVTASCTDGNTYVWDTARGDQAIHILSHGDSLDNPIHDLPRELADSGVQFASWGRTSNRLYTGSSDGKVKAWDIRAPKGKAFVRDVLTVSGGISVGAFSRDFSKLLIGDSTGKVHLLGIDEPELQEGEAEEPRKPKDTALSSYNLNGGSLHATKTRSKVIIPHAEPSPPGVFGMETDVADLTAHDMARVFLEEGQLTLHRDRKIGAVQGPNYHETQLYRREAHEENDGAKPLLPTWQAQQQYGLHGHKSALKVSSLPLITSSDLMAHADNVSLDFDFSRLALSTQEELERDRVDLDFDYEHKFEYEQLPRLKIFGVEEGL